VASEKRWRCRKEANCCSQCSGRERPGHGVAGPCAIGAELLTWIRVEMVSDQTRLGYIYQPKFEAVDKMAMVTQAKMPVSF
jgi:hypothetical protein